MMCVIDIFRSCLILRHRRSHDITVVPSTKDKAASAAGTSTTSGSLGSLARSSSATSILSCTVRQDDLPPLRSHLHAPSSSAQSASQHGLLSRPSSVINPPPALPALPARPASISGLPSIPERATAASAVAKAVTTEPEITAASTLSLSSSSLPPAASKRSSSSSSTSSSLSSASSSRATGGAAAASSVVASLLSPRGVTSTSSLPPPPPLLQPLPPLPVSAAVEDATSSSISSGSSSSHRRQRQPPTNFAPWRSTSTGSSLASSPLPLPPSSLGDTADGVTIIEVPYSENGHACQMTEEPEYAEPLCCDNALAREGSVVLQRRHLDGNALDDGDDVIRRDSRDEQDDYPYQDIYEEIRQHIDAGIKDQKQQHQQCDDDLPDVVTSAYTSGDQVYQELLDLVKEEEIKDEKRRSQLLFYPPTEAAETTATTTTVLASGDNVKVVELKFGGYAQVSRAPAAMKAPAAETTTAAAGGSATPDTPDHWLGSMDSSTVESLVSEGSGSRSSTSGGEERDSLDDLYAVPRRGRGGRHHHNNNNNRNNSNNDRDSGGESPDQHSDAVTGQPGLAHPRRVKSGYTRDPDWAPEVPEKSNLLRRSLSDAGGPKEDKPLVIDSAASDGIARDSAKAIGSLQTIGGGGGSGTASQIASKNSTRMVGQNVTCHTVNSGGGGGGIPNGPKFSPTIIKVTTSTHRNSDFDHSSQTSSNNNNATNNSDNKAEPAYPLYEELQLRKDRLI